MIPVKDDWHAKGGTWNAGGSQWMGLKLLTLESSVCVHVEFDSKERLREDVNLDESNLAYNEKISTLENDWIFNKAAFFLFFLKYYYLWG